MTDCSLARISEGAFDANLSPSKHNRFTTSSGLPQQLITEQNCNAISNRVALLPNHCESVSLLLCVKTMIGLISW